MKKEVFKLAQETKNPNVFCSWNVSSPSRRDRRIGLVLSYRLNKVTTPKHKDTPIFAFETVEDAEAFNGGLSDYVLLRCEATGITAGRAATSSPETEEELKIGIQDCFHMLQKYGRDNSGTLFCESVKPVEVLAIYKYKRIV